MNARRRGLSLMVALGLAVALPLGAWAETLDALIARHVEARGGMERLEAIRTVRMTGRAIAGPGREALVSREVRPPGRIRTEFSSQGVTSVYACDGTRCWFVDPLSGSYEAEPMAESDASLAIEQADLLGPLVGWQAKGHAVELLGKQTIDGREAYKLRLTLSGGGVRTDYLDAETALLVRRESTRTVAGRAVDLETTFSDFRPVGGVVFPHSVKSGAKGQPLLLELVVEEAVLNEPLDDARFQMPD